MKHPDDDYDDMSGLDDFGASSGRPGGAATDDTAAVTGFLADLRSLGEGPAPAPTPELQALFSGVPSIAAQRRTRSPLVRRAALIAAATVAGTTAAAAGHTLPEPAQQVVSNVVNTLTPFHISSDDVAPHPTPQLPYGHRPGGSEDDGMGAGPGPAQGGDDSGGAGESETASEDGGNAGSGAAADGGEHEDGGAGAAGAGGAGSAYGGEHGDGGEGGD